jgi:hypothetical protein
MPKYCVCYAFFFDPGEEGTPKCSIHSEKTMPGRPSAATEKALNLKEHKMNKPEFTFPVINGMVAVEHVRYLKQERDSLAKALRRLVNSAPGGFAGDPMIGARRDAEALLDECGE